MICTGIHALFLCHVVVMDKLPPSGNLNFDVGNLSKAWRRRDSTLSCFWPRQNPTVYPIKFNHLSYMYWQKEAKHLLYFDFANDADHLNVAIILQKFEEFFSPRNASS